MEMSSIQVPCKLNFEKLNDLLEPHLAGMEVGEVMRLESFRLKGDGSYLYGLAEITGTYDGPIVIQFIPEYNRAWDRFDLKDLKIELAKTNLLAKGANWIIKKLMTDKLDKKFEEVLNAQYQKAKQGILENLERLDMKYGFYLVGNIDYLDFKDIRSKENHLCFDVEVRGTFHLNL